MATSESARSSRPVTTATLSQECRPKTKKQCGKLTTFLLSCCLFLSVMCMCMVAALIIIGKHYLYNDRVEHIDDVSERPIHDHLIQRLPRDVTPSHYDVTLMPNLKTGLFTGTVNITLRLGTSREFIELHSNNLSIGVISLQLAGNLSVLELHQVNTDHRKQLLKIATEQTLYPGDYHLVINFKGSLLNKTKGFYRSKYIDLQNRTRYIATSKFEPTDARQAFPCFDEPDMKATFTVHLLKPRNENYIALSNMPQVSEDEVENGIMVHFQTSVNMSTYLICFIVCDFEYTEDYILDKIPFRVYSSPNQIAKTEYARRVGKKVIEYYIDYFGIEFPLPKLDMAAIPDFVSGAMENWGLITYRETSLLFGEEISSTANKQRVASVIAHEFAHSWFGNLVTMRWWNDIWLNEGFASYIEYKGMNFAHPDWHIMDHFLVQDLHPVLNVDSKLSSHPIVMQVSTPDEITEIFDNISYKKGASILRMLEDTVGVQKFRDGVTAYLKTYAYGNAVTQDLWDELQTIVGGTLNVTDFMATWTLQMGYPMVEVKSTDHSYILTQKRFLEDPNNKGIVKSPFAYRWTIPITYISSENSNPTYVMFHHSQEEVTVPKISSAKWIKFNYNQVGYYRVNYEEAHWKTLIKHIGEMTVPDKAHLLEESFRIAQSGQLSYDIPLDLTKYLVDETGDYNYLPWDVAWTVLVKFNLYLQNSAYLDQYKRYVLKLVSPAYDNLTWTENENDSHSRRLARVVVLRLACAMGHKKCLATASDLFIKYLDGEVALSQNLRTLVYNFGVEASSNDRWLQLWDKYVREGYASEKQKLITGLTYSKDPTMLTRLLTLAEDENYVRTGDYLSCLSSIGANPIGTPIVWDYVREIWPALVDKFGLNEKYLGRVIPAITKRFTTGTKLEEMEAFFAKYPEAGAGASSRANALETVRNNIMWLKKYKKDVERWLKDNTN